MTAINGDNQQYKKPGVGACVGGVLVGSAVSTAVQYPAQVISPNLMKKMAKLSNDLTADEFTSIKDAFSKVVKNSGLSDKGVEIIRATAENSKEINEIMAKELENGFTSKIMPKSFKEFMGKTYSSMVKNGENAFYAFKSKKIVLPEGKQLALASFHEAGHAVNHTISKIGKILQKSRPLQKLAIPIALIALWKTKKAPGEEPKNGVDKATTFVKNNAGKLTFAAFLPTLLEEGLASFRGNKFAKQLLTPDLAKKVAKTNAFGFATYLAMAALSSLGIAAAVKVKDSIAKPKPVEKA